MFTMEIRKNFYTKVAVKKIKIGMEQNSESKEKVKFGYSDWIVN